MADNLYPGDTVSRTLTFTDEDDDLFDPTTIAVLTINPSGVTVHTDAIGDLVRTSLGVYEYSYNLAADAPTGQWHLEVTATGGGLVNTEQFPFIVEALTSLRYGDLDTVKDLCGITRTELEFDIQLNQTLIAAEDFINIALERCGATVPLSNPESILRDAANYLAAGLYKQKDVPDEKVHSFYTIGLGFLNEYIATNYPGESLVPSTPESSTTTVTTLAYNVGLAT